MSKLDLLKFCEDLYDFPRSLTGDGVRATLKYISNIIPIEIKSVGCGSNVFDWVVPPEWNVESAILIEDSTGRIVADFSQHRLHLVGYSIPMNATINYKDLVKKLHYIKELPSAIPYVTSYYKKDWGFCISYNEFKTLDKKSTFTVRINSSLNEKGSLNYGELLIEGKSKKEIFFSSYICHPQMVNNELSGPSVLTGIAKKILSKNNHFSYRFVLVPETIGSIVYLSKNLKQLKDYVIGGYNITCVGDERSWGLIPSRYGNNISDKIAEHVLINNVEKFEKFTWLDRGSDERQYCAPGIDLPISSITRTKYGEYPEYHTSLDNFDVVTREGLKESLKIYMECVNVFEHGVSIFPKIKILGEPQLGKRGLYPNISTKDSVGTQINNMMNFISYCDGSNTIFDIANLCGISFSEAKTIFDKLYSENLLAI